MNARFRRGGIFPRHGRFSAALDALDPKLVNVGRQRLVLFVIELIWFTPHYRFLVLMEWYAQEILVVGDYLYCLRDGEGAPHWFSREGDVAAEEFGGVFYAAIVRVEVFFCGGWRRFA